MPEAFSAPSPHIAPEQAAGEKAADHMLDLVLFYAKDIVAIVTPGGGSLRVLPGDYAGDQFVVEGGGERLGPRLRG